MMKSLCFGLLVFGVCVWPCVAVNAQTASPPPNLPLSVPTTAPEANKWGRFETAFAALSEHYQTAIVCEAAPFRPALAPPEAVALQKALTAVPFLSKQEAITTAANAFDYDPVFVDAHTVLLFKRYSRPQDLPEVTLNEASSFLNTLLKETAPFTASNGASSNRMIMKLLNEATPPQRTAFAAGVNWDTLPTDFQKQYLFVKRSETLDLCLTPLQNIADRLNGVRKQGRTNFKTLDFHGVFVSAYEGSFGSPTAPDAGTVVLRKYIKTLPDGKTLYLPPAALPHLKTLPDGQQVGVVPATPPPLSPNAQIADPLPDPTTPTDTEKNAPPQRPLACQKTMEQIALEINAVLSQKKAATGIAGVAVSSTIQQKTVSWFGAGRFLSPMEQVKAAAQVAGLHVSEGTDRIARIGPPPPRTIDDATQIGREVIRLLPISLLHALRRRSGYDPGSLHAPPPDTEEQWGRHIADPMSRDASDAIYTEAVKRLRLMVEPSLFGANGGKVALSALPADTGNLLALASLSDVSGPLKELIAPHFAPLPPQTPRSGTTFKAFQQGDTVNGEIHFPPDEHRSGNFGIGTAFKAFP